MDAIHTKLFVCPSDLDYKVHFARLINFVLVTEDGSNPILSYLFYNVLIKAYAMG